MSISLTTTTGKVLASAVLVAGAAGAAGLGTFGSFTSSTSASTTVGSGTVAIAVGADGVANRLSVPATGLVPGDSIARAVTLSNTGSQALSAVTLTSTASTSSKLDTDTTNGLQMSIASCSVPWTEANAPKYSYTCSGTTKSVLAARPVIGSNLALNNLNSLAAGASDNLVVTLSFPATADNSLQNQSSVLGLAFTGTQRAAVTQ